MTACIRSEQGPTGGESPLDQAHGSADLQPQLGVFLLQPLRIPVGATTAQRMLPDRERAAPQPPDGKRLQGPHDRDGQGPGCHRAGPHGVRNQRPAGRRLVRRLVRRLKPSAAQDIRRAHVAPTVEADQLQLVVPRRAEARLLGERRREHLVQSPARRWPRRALAHGTVASIEVDEGPHRRGGKEVPGALRGAREESSTRQLLAPGKAPER
mmetsp:Transcript_54152/g.174997  ORF Transcript_54152/g.174997 Transcript_54152/m.174997 type:complete len:211 (+) Transcript_54152:338-970(+)